jgi:glycosyltransferase involved in cell wall biosynthesis
VPVIWDSVDCISHLFQQAAGQSQSFFGRFVTRFELPRTRRAEGNLICSFDHVLVTSGSDKNALLELAPRGREPSPISVLPNGVDLEYFHPTSDVQREIATIVFSGKMSYHANISMAKYLVSEIMPRVWKECPDARLVIVGKDPPADVRKFAQDARITVTGTVDDIRPFLWQATVSIVPLLYGAGIQNKILEAMATATPVITTARTLSALQAQPGRDILIAGDAAEFARKVLWVIKDKNLRQAIGDSALAYVKSHHDWNSITSRMVQIYQRALNKTGRLLQ